MAPPFRFSTFHTQLKFRRPAGTSRGVYTTRDVWYVVLSSVEDPFRLGVGECAPLPGLSCDALPDYGSRLSRICRKIEETGALDREALRPYPSILFGLETAFRHFETGSYALWDTPFARGEAGIPINGLIWMGAHAAMLKQIEAKLEAGFHCLKLKIGAIGFEEELSLLRYVRKHFSPREVEIRVDANGAFTPHEAPGRLEQLAKSGIHSIEQPIRAGQWEEMAKLAANTPLPIALDEELTGCHSPEAKEELLKAIRPQYIILKPSLHGGMSGCGEWISIANRLEDIGWWITSALESNIGLNVVAQWCATLGNPLPQGLGTGGLYVDNVELPLEVRGERLWFTPLDGVEPFPLPMKQGTVSVQTSGSTGKPKLIRIRKEQMLHSASLTCSKLGLQPGDTALLCMPQQYIGAQMMLVRTLAAGLDLTVREPSGHPFAGLNASFDFAAMTPLQVYNSLQVPAEKELLRQTKCLLIGGGAIDPALEEELQAFPHAVFSTYGMTETVSHIALRRLNGPAASLWYEPLPSVKVSLAEDNTLQIDAPLLCGAVVATHDIAVLRPDGCFRILGRKDNVINSGGVKIQIETVEKKLRPAIRVPFAITSFPDSKFGETVILLVEKGADISAIQDQIPRLLSKYEQPRRIIEIEALPLTPNGKTDRLAITNYEIKNTET